MPNEENKRKIVEGYQDIGYQESDTVKKAQELLQQQLGKKPGDYQSQWQSQLNDTLQKILNREDFRYDLNGDALYQQYKNQFTTQGKMAMMDTMGQAQAMTGGYGNSYAQSVGQQTYQGYLQDLNDVIPELYQLALGKYQMEGEEMKDRFAMLQQQENQDYGRYQDQLSQWQAERDYLTGRYDSERDYDYGKYADNRDFGYNQYVNDRDYAFRQEQAAQEQQRWQAEFDEAQRQFNEQMAMQQAAKSSGGSGGGGGGYAGNGGVDAGTVRKAQAFVGTSADGMWGPNSQKAAAAMGYGSLSEVIAAMGGGGGTSGGNVGVNMDSVLGLGYGPISAEKLNDLVQSGEVEEYVQNGQYYFKNNEQKNPVFPLLSYKK